jgi:transcriptional regulator with GAF, ATPase, and Fis domain
MADEVLSGTLTATEPPEARERAGAALYLVMEYRRLAAGGVRWSLAGLDEVRIGRAPSRGAARALEGDCQRLDVGVPDALMSSRHARLARLGDRWALEDLGSKNGCRVNGKHVPRAVLGDGDRIELGETLLLFRDEAQVEADGDAAILGDCLATLSPAFGRELERLAAVARARVPVLIMGETGTGKEVTARAVHALSGRRGRFVAVNCGALPDGLVEASLFGHRRGAFSGAVDDRPGLVKSAHGGTLLLDEIGDLPPPSQAALLRVLQESEVMAVGDSEPARVDVRFIAATHRDLGALAREERFRADLLARLEGYRVTLPPLRDRREDLGVVIASVLARLAPGREVALLPEAARALAAYDWPANVRELEQALAAALALADGGAIARDHLPEALRSEPIDHPATSARRPPPLSPEDVALRERLIALLEEHAGNIAAVARALHKDRTQVRRWLGRFGLDPEHFR